MHPSVLVQRKPEFIGPIVSESHGRRRVEDVAAACREGLSLVCKSRRKDSGSFEVRRRFSAWSRTYLTHKWIKLGWISSSAAKLLTGTLSARCRRTTLALNSSEKCLRFVPTEFSLHSRCANAGMEEFQFHQRQDKTNNRLE